MVEKLKYLWENLWLVAVIIAVLVAIYLVPKDEIYNYFYPKATVFKTESTEYYQVVIPKDWIVYDGADKQLKVYSDLSVNAFVSGILTVYKYDFVAPNNLEEYCKRDSEEIAEVIGANATLKEQKSSYDLSSKRCVTELKIEIENSSDTNLKTQYHTYLTYVVGEDMLMFELISPDKKQSTDLHTIIDSIEVFEPDVE